MEKPMSDPIKEIPGEENGSSLTLLYEDNHILAVEKPEGVLSQSDSSGAPDLLTLSKEFLKRKYQKPGNVYLGLVHRLDRAVGGVMVFARTSKAAARLSEHFKNHTVRKIYHAVVEGKPREESGERTDWIVKESKIKMARSGRPGEKEAKEARLRYRLLSTRQVEGLGEVSLLEVELLTGRFHQIRFQMSRMGHPVLGDRKYGSRFSIGKHRLALRATRLELTHPVRKTPLILESPDPDGWPFA